jgi:hypothetical protein
MMNLTKDEARTVLMALLWYPWHNTSSKPKLITKIITNCPELQSVIDRYNKEEARR